MNLRHSLSLTVSSVTLILKVLLYTTVLFLIAFALFMAITEPIIESFGSEFDMIAELQEDFSKLKEKKREEQKLQRQLRQREEGRFLFDWQDSASLLKKDTVRKKYNTSEDFRIEFEDD